VGESYVRDVFEKGEAGKRVFGSCCLKENVIVLGFNVDLYRCRFGMGRKFIPLLNTHRD